LETKQGLTSNKVDLTAIAAAHPIYQQIAVLDLNTFDATQLTLLEILDMSEATGVEPELLGTLLSPKGQTKKRMVMLYAMAWCIARRADPTLRFAEVCTWKLEIIGETDPAKTQASLQRADKIVGAAIVSGLPPAEAGQLTVAQLDAYANRRKRRRAR
jgi:hypothetical protein